MYVIYVCSSKADKLLSVIGLLVQFKADILGFPRTKVHQNKGVKS